MVMGGGGGDPAQLGLPPSLRTYTYDVVVIRIRRCEQVGTSITTGWQLRASMSLVPRPFISQFPCYF